MRRNLFNTLVIFLFIPFLLLGCSEDSTTSYTRPERIIPPNRHFPAGIQDVSIPPVNGVRPDLLRNIAPLVEKSITAGYYPGAVIIATHRGHIIYRGVFGDKRIVPTVAPMRFDTIFDIASLTKVVATTPAIMQLVEQGKLDLDAPVIRYWPSFGEHGKYAITIRELLTHTSGLQPDLPDFPSDTPYGEPGEQHILHQIEQLSLHHQPGTTFVYSDINFIVLAHLVQIITGQRIDVYAQNHIFKPLGMNDTFFRPAENLHERIAPTEMFNHQLRWGKVHDFTAYAMGGVSGNAGLFSNAHDLMLYTQSLLNGGRVTHPTQQTPYLLGPLTLQKMETPQSLPGPTSARALGWDIDSPYSNRGVLFPISSFGHTGYTGTSIWIDPTTQTALIILTSRTHPEPTSHNQIAQDRRTIANMVAASLTDISISQANTGEGELHRAYPTTGNHS